MHCTLPPIKCQYPCDINIRVIASNNASYTRQYQAYVILRRNSVSTKSSVPPIKCQYSRVANIPKCKYPCGATVYANQNISTITSPLIALLAQNSG